METTLIKSSGTLRFGNCNVVVDVDKELVNYYYSLIPKYFNSRRQGWDAHITVVRSNYETWPKSIDWTGKTIHFMYENQIRFDGVYFYLDVFSDEIGKIRQGLGLEYYRWPFDRYHITISKLGIYNGSF